MLDDERELSTFKILTVTGKPKTLANQLPLMHPNKNQGLGLKIYRF